MKFYLWQYDIRMSRAVSTFSSRLTKIGWFWLGISRLDQKCENVEKNPRFYNWLQFQLFRKYNLNILIWNYDIIFFQMSMNSWTFFNSNKVRFTIFLISLFWSTDKWNSIKEIKLRAKKILDTSVIFFSDLIPNRKKLSS